ncbi:MAG: asparagine synthase (glutamine-hydrolyzing) [Steroidobacteraceae bacterium]
MCGIAGILPDRNADPAELSRWVRQMTARLVHRGPDDVGYYVTERIALGMRRLAIIDVAHGQQPMFGRGRRSALVFNGEIYNYRKLKPELASAGWHFETQSDTEAVLAALETWGKDGLKRLEGMFGLAHWDEQAGLLTLARDWLGQKSIYWTRCAQGFAFASEVNPLLELPGVERKPDLQAMSHYMGLRYLPGESTFFKGISKLPAAHALTHDGEELRLTRLWTPAYEPKHRKPESELIDELDELMREVVGEHLMSEVPLGAFLSGGIDSSLVAAYAARALKAPLRTFSIGVDESSQSELPWARMVAERYGTSHSETLVQPDLAALAPRMVKSMAEPVDPFACGVYIVSEVAASQVTVALGGDGGDELFAGYDRYKGQELAELYGQFPRSIRHGLLRPVIRQIPDSFGYNTITSKLRWLDRMADRKGFERYAESAAFLRFTQERKQALFTRTAWREVGSLASERLLEQFFNDGSARTFLDRMLHTDCMTRLADHQLPIVDKMAMAHSLELRNPFLDRRVFEFAARLPSSLKLKSRRLKYVTRKLGERYLPRELLYRRKQGFGFPLARWLRGELRDMMTGVLAESRLAEAGIFDRAAMDALTNEHMAGTVDHNYRLWMIFNIEVFWRHFFDGESVAALEDWIARLRNPTGVRRATG